MRNLYPLLFGLAFLLVNSIGAQTYYIREGATGSNTGSDWINAYPGLPEVLERGATYYIADGNYTGYTFDDATDGYAYITIKKAVEEDHGEASGWQNDFGDGVAVFESGLVFHTGYYIFDGQTGGGPGQWDSGHGFEVIGDWGEEVTFGLIIQFSGGSASNIQIKHVYMHSLVPFQGYGSAFNGSDNSNILISHCYIPELFGVHLSTRHVKQYTVEYSYFYRNESTSKWHAEFSSDIGSDSMIFRYNKFNEIDGTAVFAGVNGSADDPQDYWEIYGNICINSVAFVHYYFVENDDENIARYWKIYNNTIVGPRGGNINIQNGVDIEVVNNIWYNFYEAEVIDVDGSIIYTDGKVRFYYTANSTCNSLYDVYYSFQLSNFVFGQEVVSSDSLDNEKLPGDPFRTSIIEDYYLEAPISQGKFLTYPYNYDMFGNVRGLDGAWDRGALEYDTTITGHHRRTVINVQSKTICNDDSVLINGQYQHVSGTYYETYQINDELDSVIVINLIVSICTDLNNNQIRQSCKVYPIPTNSKLNVEIERFKEMEIYNCMGRFIARTKERSFDFSPYNTGIYILHIFDTDGARITKRIIYAN